MKVIVFSLLLTGLLFSCSKEEQLSNEVTQSTQVNGKELKAASCRLALSRCKHPVNEEETGQLYGHECLYQGDGCGCNASRCFYRGNLFMAVLGTLSQQDQDFFLAGNLTVEWVNDHYATIEALHNIDGAVAHPSDLINGIIADQP